MRKFSFFRQIIISQTLIVATGGCGQILGLGDFAEGTSGAGASSSGSTGGSGTTATSTTGGGGDSQGGGGTATTGSSTSGTGGAGGTGGKGGSGGAGGAGGTPCVPTGVEDCSKSGDEDCNGVACSDVRWSDRFGSAGEQNATSIAVDGQGHVLLAGFFAGTMTFGDKILISSGMNDYYLAKLDGAGKPIWAQQFGDASDNGKLAHVAVDKAGNIFLAGALSGSADFGGGTLTSAGDTDAFVAAFDPQGTPIWSKRFGDSATQRVNSIAVDGTGNPIIAGTFAGSINFGGGILTSPSSIFDGFIVKLAPDGSPLTIKRFGDAAGQNASFQEIIGIAVDPASNILARGNFATSIDFNGASLLAGSYFIAKFDSSINHSWSKKLALGGQRSLMASDMAGNMIFGGQFTGVADLDGHPVVGSTYSIYTAKFDTLGQFQWVQPSNASKAIDLVDLATDVSGAIVITGSTFGDVNFGNGQLMNVGQDSNMFLAKFGPNGGNALWSKMFGGAGQHDPTAVATDPTTKEILLTGMITQTVDFGAGALNSMGGYDVVVAKFQP